MSQPNLDQVFLSLVQRFVERQSIVLEAMEEVCPSRLFMARGRGDQQPKEFIEEFARLCNHDSAQLGEWSGEWEYFWHGFGCRLRNLNTGEIIEWDAPDIQAFDRYWLSNWFAWALAQQPQGTDEALVHTALVYSGQSVDNFVYATLDRLSAAGLIIKTFSKERVAKK